jgi:hypothetical protein
MMVRLACLLLVGLALQACSSPCDRLARDFQRHNDALLADPSLSDNELYNLRTVRLTADMVSYGCF